LRGKTFRKKSSSSGTDLSGNRPALEALGLDEESIAEKMREMLGVG
jgi:hypothetical protein